MTEFTKEWIEEIKENIAYSVRKNFLSVDDGKLFIESFDEIQRLQSREEDCHRIIDKVLDNRNVGMLTGDSTLSFRLEELVSYYENFQSQLKHVEDKKQTVFEQLTNTIERRDAYIKKLEEIIPDLNLHIAKASLRVQELEADKKISICRWIVVRHFDRPSMWEWWTFTPSCTVRKSRIQERQNNKIDFIYCPYCSKKIEYVEE